MAMVPVPWARRRWGLPFLTILAPSERWALAHGRRHKKLTAWARQTVLQTWRWLGKRKIVVADSSFAALDLIAALHRMVTFVTRLLLDANLFEPRSPRARGQRGYPAKKGRRLPKLCGVLKDKKTRWTRLRMPYWYGDERCALEIVTGTAVWLHPGKPPVAIRWVLVRDPTGRRVPAGFPLHRPRRVARELPRLVRREVVHGNDLRRKSRPPWRRDAATMVDLAIARTTPALFGLFSLVTLWAADARIVPTPRPRSAAWYHKVEPTFSDAIAAVRKLFWAAPNLSTCRDSPDHVEIPASLWNRCAKTLAFAA